MTKDRIQWLGAEWDAEKICTPQGVPYCYQIYGYPVAPGSARLNAWVPLSNLGPLPALSIESAKSVLETIGSVEVHVTLDPADGDSTITVNWNTVDGTAIAGTHYTASSGTLTFSPNDTDEIITVPILDANTVSPVTFTIALGSPINATIAASVCTVTINPDGGSG